jgi:large subunit ribosomal protein L30
MVTKMSNNKLAVVLIRGTVNTHPDVRKTLELLRLKKKHACVVVDNTSENRGMLKRVKDYATYGVIEESFFTEILEKRGEFVGQKLISSSSEKIDCKKLASEFFAGNLKLREFVEKYNVKPFFRLHPPIGGFERKGIKMPFAKGGVLGNREEKIKELIEKML